MPLCIVADSFNDLFGFLAFVAADAGGAQRLGLRLSILALLIRLRHLVLSLLDVLLSWGVGLQVLHRSRDLRMDEVGVHGIRVVFLCLIVIVNVK